MDINSAITSLAALVGMVLGVYNFLHAREAERVSLRVTPKSSSFQGSDHSGRNFYLHNRDRFDVDHPTSPPDTLSVEVVNLSKFAVIVDEVGLRSWWRRNRIALPNPIVLDGGGWPRRLEPREGVTVSFDLTNLLGSALLPSVSDAYASTTCGVKCYGKSGALRELVKHAKLLS